MRPPLSLSNPLFNAWFFLGGAVSFHGYRLERATEGMRPLLPYALAVFAALAFCHAFDVRVPAFLTVVPFLVAGSLFASVRENAGRLPRWLPGLARSATYVYFAHVFTGKALLPLLYALIPLESGGGWAALAYVVRTVATTALTIAQYYLLRAFAPGFLSAITGRRSG